MKIEHKMSAARLDRQTVEAMVAVNPDILFDGDLAVRHPELREQKLVVVLPPEWMEINLVMD